MKLTLLVSRGAGKTMSMLVSLSSDSGAACSSRSTIAYFVDRSSCRLARYSRQRVSTEFIAYSQFIHLNASVWLLLLILHTQHTHIHTQSYGLLCIIKFPRTIPRTIYARNIAHQPSLTQKHRRTFISPLEMVGSAEGCKITFDGPWAVRFIIVKTEGKWYYFEFVNICNVHFVYATNCLKRFQWIWCTVMNTLAFHPMDRSEWNWMFLLITYIVSCNDRNDLRFIRIRFHRYGKLNSFTHTGREKRNEKKAWISKLPHIVLIKYRKRKQRKKNGTALNGIFCIALM